LESPSQQASFPSGLLKGVKKVSIVESRFSNFNLTNQTGPLLGVPIELRFDSLPCNSTHPVFTNSSCVTQITLRKLFSRLNSDLRHQSIMTAMHSNYHDKRFDVDSAEKEVEFVELDCLAGDDSIHNVSCSSGDVIQLMCVGSAGVVRRQCPIYNSSTVCVSLLENQVCQVMTTGDENITCQCSLVSSDIVDVTSAKLDFGVLSLSLIHEFASTWSSADDLTASQVNHNLLVLLTVGSVGFVGVLLVLTSMKMDSRDHIKAISDKDMRVLRKQRSVRKSFHRTIGCVSVGSVESKRIDECLPFVLRPVPLVDKCKNELRMYHRWAGILFHYSESFSRSLRASSLVIGILTMLFVQSVTYDLAYPDNGSCGRQSTMTTCLKEKSMMSNANKCEWNTESLSCSFRPIQNDSDMMLVVALISGILSAPFSILFQSLILFVLAAKTRPSNEILKRQRSFRGSSITPDRTSSRFDGTTVSNLSSIRGDDILETSLPEDLNKLLSGVRLYRQHLNAETLLDFDSKICRPHTSLTPMLLSLSLSLSQISGDLRQLTKSILQQ
jgi:hypothetical protein